MHLDYRDRIRLESVCPSWRALALNYAWKDQRILRFSREMLHLDEPWQDKKRINSIIDELNSQQNEVHSKKKLTLLNMGTIAQKSIVDAHFVNHIWQYKNSYVVNIKCRQCAINLSFHEILTYGIPIPKYRS
jgi:hypothetical protein